MGDMAEERIQVDRCKKEMRAKWSEVQDNNGENLGKNESPLILKPLITK